MRSAGRVGEWCVWVGNDAVRCLLLLLVSWSDHLTISQYRTKRVYLVYGKDSKERSCGYDGCKKIILKLTKGFSKVTR